MDLQVLREDKERREPRYPNPQIKICNQQKNTIKKIYTHLTLSKRVNQAWKVLKERQVQLVLKDHLASLVLKASGVFLAQL